MELDRLGHIEEVLQEGKLMQAEASLKELLD